MLVEHYGFKDVHVSWDVYTYADKEGKLHAKKLPHWYMSKIAQEGSRLETENTPLYIERDRLIELLELEDA